MSRVWIRDRCAALLGLLVLAAALVWSVPGAAQEEDPGAPDPLEIQLQAIRSVLAPDEPEAAISAVLGLAAGDQRREDLRLVTTVYARVDSRAALQEAMAGDLPTVFSAESSPLPDLAAGTNQVVSTSTPRAALALQDAERAGIHPLQFQVFQAGDPVGQVLTSLVVLPPAGPAPLPATTVLRVTAADAVPMADVVAGGGLLGTVAPDAPLRRFAADVDVLVADGSAAGVTILASGRLLEDLAAVAAGVTTTTAGGEPIAATDRVARRAASVVQQLRRLAARADTEALSLPYGPADLVALVRGGLAAQALELVQIGTERTAAVLDTTVAGGILAPPDGIDAPTLAALGAAQPDAVLLEAPYLSFAEEDGMEPVRRLRTADGGEVRLLVPDTDLSQLLTDPRQQGTAWVVQDLLAQTAVQWLEGRDPGSTAALMVLDVAEDLPPRIASAASGAIADAPWLQPVSLSVLGERVDPSDRVVRLAYPPRSAASELDADYIAQLGDARAALGPLAALLPEDDTTTAGYAEAMLTVASTAYRGPGGNAAGAARTGVVLDRLAALGGAVEILPSPPITLTSTTGEVPVTLTNTGGVPVRVRVVLSSTRFAFPDGDTRDVALPPRSSQQLAITTESLTPGGFAAITVTVQDPGLGATLAQTRISVRSTAFPVVGLVATIGSGIVLVVWGARQSLRRRRRPGRHEAETAHRSSGVA